MSDKGLGDRLEHPGAGRRWFWLGCIWLVGAVGDRLWFALDRSVPSWDPADYLTGSLNYWQALQDPRWFSSSWWTSLWLLSSKIPPLTYIATTPLMNWFGRGFDEATLVYLIFGAVLLGSVYCLGNHLFDWRVGLWAAGLCLLFPGLYQVRLTFLLDYPLTAMVALCFWCLTAWRGTADREKASPMFVRWQSWGWAIAFGLSLGLALMVKQTAIMFLLVPVLWAGGTTLWQRAWERLGQWLVALAASVLVWGWWYRANWLLVLTSSRRAVVDAAIAEGDPPLNTLAAWTFYWQDLPHIVSWVLLVVPLVGWILLGFRRLMKQRDRTALPLPPASLRWLGVFLIGAYLLCSLSTNKDSRYVLPYLPALALVLACGWVSWRQAWVRWGTVAVALGLMTINLFPLGNYPAFLVNPRSQHRAHLGARYPHPEAIATVIQTAPYVRSTVGVLPSTGEVNQHNMNYYGALANFQVYGRQVGVRESFLQKDVRSLDWFLTKTGDQGSVPEVQPLAVQAVEQNPEFQAQAAMPLPDGSLLQLYHRQVPALTVMPVASVTETGDRVRLVNVTVPAQVPPGVPMPVTYEWMGSATQLQAGIVILTWQGAQHPWQHDRGIGAGNLFLRSCSPTSSEATDASSDRPCQFRVTERTATLPPVESAGTYTLEATYLNRNTGETYPIAAPSVTVTVTPAAPAMPAPEVDLVTQLRSLGGRLPLGMDALTSVFDEIGRISQYDPTQDYTQQTAASLAYRLQQEPQRTDWAYALGLAYVLQQRVPDAIAAFERVTALDAQNPFAHAYLAFVRLYNWQPSAARASLDRAIALAPNQPEFFALRGVAGLMQGNLVQVWRDVRVFQRLTETLQKSN